MACVHATAKASRTTAKCLITLSSLQWPTIANNDGERRLVQSAIVQPQHRAIINVKRERGTRYGGRGKLRRLGLVRAKKARGQEAATPCPSLAFKQRWAVTPITYTNAHHVYFRLFCRALFCVIGTRGKGPRDLMRGSHHKVSVLACLRGGPRKPRSAPHVYQNSTRFCCRRADARRSGVYPGLS